MIRKSHEHEHLVSYRCLFESTGFYRDRWLRWGEFKRCRWDSGTQHVDLLPLICYLSPLRGQKEAHMVKKTAPTKTRGLAQGGTKPPPTSLSSNPPVQLVPPTGRTLLRAREQSMKVCLLVQSKADKCGMRIWLKRGRAQKIKCRITA